MQYEPISNDFVTKFANEEYTTPNIPGHSITVGVSIGFVDTGTTGVRYGAWTLRSHKETDWGSSSSLSGADSRNFEWVDLLDTVLPLLGRFVYDVRRGVRPNFACTSPSA